MNRILLTSLLLLNACTFDLRGSGEPLRVEVSEYPETVLQGETFEVFIDVLSVTEPLEVLVAPSEGLSVDETIGSSYLLLSVTASSLASPGAHTLTAELRSGSATTQLTLGFAVASTTAP